MLNCSAGAFPVWGILMFDIEWWSCLKKTQIKTKNKRLLTVAFITKTLYILNAIQHHWNLKEKMSCVNKEIKRLENLKKVIANFIYKFYKSFVFDYCDKIKLGVREKKR